MLALNLLKNISKTNQVLKSKYIRLGKLNVESISNVQNQCMRQFSASYLMRNSQNNNNDNSEKRQITSGEKKLIDMLKKRFPTAKTIEVNDISGGCGSMYEIFVETDEFKTMRKVKQHQIINQVLQSEIKNNMHGLRIYTAVPGEE